MPTLATTRVTEALTSLVTLPTAQSVICDNYSQSYLFIQEAGVYVPPYNTRIISLPSPLSSITLMWQTPPGLTAPPIGVPPGYASCIFSSNAAETSLPQPLFASQSASVPLQVVTLGSNQSATQVKIPVGIQSLVLIPRSTTNPLTSVFIQGNTSGDIYYDATPTEELPIIIETLNPNDTYITLAGGSPTTVWDLIGYPFPLAPNNLQVTSSAQAPVYTSVIAPVGSVPSLLGTLTMPNGQQVASAGYTAPQNSVGLLVITVPPPLTISPTIIIGEGVSGNGFGDVYAPGTGGELFASIPGAAENPVLAEIVWDAINPNAAVVCAYVYAMVTPNTPYGTMLSTNLESVANGGNVLPAPPAGSVYRIYEIDVNAAAADYGNLSNTLWFPIPAAPTMTVIQYEQPSIFSGAVTYNAKTINQNININVRYTLTSA